MKKSNIEIPFKTLKSAILHEDVDMIQVWFNIGVGVNDTLATDVNMTPLKLAISRNKIQSSAYLLKQGALVYPQDFLLALEYASPSLLQILVQTHPTLLQPALVEQLLKTALCLPHDNKLAKMKILRPFFPNPIDDLFQNEWTYLHRVLLQDDRETFVYLIEQGFSMHHDDALMHYLERCQILAVRIMSYLKGIDIAKPMVQKKRNPIDVLLTHTLNPHRHVKIWLSRDPSSYMNHENQLRLVQMRASCPGDEIYVVYDSKLLTEESCRAFHRFAYKIGVILKDVRVDVVPICQNLPLEHKILDHYDAELDSLDQGGNLAAASDLLRWLSPVYSLGIYTDFDVKVSTRNLPETVQVAGDLILNAKSMVRGEQYQFFLCNDILMIANPHTHYIKTIQKMILNRAEDGVKLSCRHYYMAVLRAQESFLYQGLSASSLSLSVLNQTVKALESSNKHYMLALIFVAGPGMLTDMIMQKQSFFDEAQFLNHTSLALSEYPDLFASFQSYQPYTLHDEPKTESKFTHSDLSWLSLGLVRQKHREAQLDTSARTIQSFFKRHCSIENVVGLPVQSHTYP